jgi:hypothetical protein
LPFFKFPNVRPVCFAGSEKVVIGKAQEYDRIVQIKKMYVKAHDFF